MPLTPNMNLTLPTEGASDDVWDLLLNTALGSTGVDGHDHTTGKGVPVPSAALRINADVSWAYSGTNYAITDAKAIDFAETAPADVASFAGALFVSSVDSELYYRSTAGTNIKITAGSTLNVSIVGGIGGDYAAVSALLDYDDATDTYRARQEESSGVRQFAKFSIADLIIREYDAAGDATVPVETVTIKSPDALAASYSLTLLAALPVSTVALQVSSAGVVTASNTFDDIRLTATRAIPIPCLTSQQIAPGTPHSKGVTFWTLANSLEPVFYPIVGLKDGDRITAHTTVIRKLTSAATTHRARLYKSTAAGVNSLVGAGVSNSANAPGYTTIQEGSLTEDVGTATQYYLEVTPTAGTPTNDEYHHTIISVTRP
jgi:hypothetical protein